MGRAAISADIDTLASIYGGYDLRRDAYTYAEFSMGLENFCRFLEGFGVRATMFMVGADFRQPQNVGAIRAVAAAGHEIANHTLTHAQGFRLLSRQQQEDEVAGMEQLCRQVTGQRPVGFRSPGWNAGDETADILVRRGYWYDSSVFPSLANPMLKLVHWWTTRGRDRLARSTLGPLRYAIARVRPYRTSRRSLVKSGSDGVLEFPVTVVPGVRFPFTATFTLALGWSSFRASYAVLRAMSMPIQYQFHLSDFVDYSHPALADQVPRRAGAYVPQALRVGLERKLALFARVVERIGADYQFSTLRDWAVDA